MIVGKAIDCVLDIREIIFFILPFLVYFWFVSDGSARVEKTDLVLSLLPDVLCARSKCHLKMGRWKNALADAQLVLSR